MKRLLALALLASSLAGTGCAPAYRMQPNVADLMLASAVTPPQQREAPAAEQAPARGHGVNGCAEGGSYVK